MLEYFRMVGKGGGGKEKEEKNVEVENTSGNKPIDTASLITALHPFGQGGVKICSKLCDVCGCFSSPLVMTLVCLLHGTLCGNIWVDCGCNSRDGDVEYDLKMTRPTSYNDLIITGQSLYKWHIICT